MIKHKIAKPLLPKNRPIKPADLKAQAATQTHESVKSRLSEFWRMTRDQLQDLITHPDTSMGDIALAAILVGAAKEGDQQKLQFVLDRMVGKVRPAHDTLLLENDHLVNIPSEKLLQLVQELQIDVKGVSVE
jgi:hypothetical protein